MNTEPAIVETDDAGRRNRMTIEQQEKNMKANYKFGWIPDLPDRRDILFRQIFRMPAKLPERVDLREKCSPIEDQGDLGSCTAQALVGALEFLEIQNAISLGVTAAVGFADLSRLFVYYNERLVEGTVFYDSGAYIRDGIKVLKKWGVCREILWKYDTSEFTKKPPASCYTEAEKHQITSYQRLQKLDEMKACLAMGLPFVGGFTCYDSLMADEVAKSGDVPMPKDDESVIGGHAILFVGYDDATKKVIFRNSWGEGWGNKGYGTLPYDYLVPDLSDDFWVIQTVESNLYCLKMGFTAADLAMA